MSGYLTRRDTIAVMVMQAIIIKREVLRLTPEQTALSALEHADALLETMGGQQRKTRKPSPKSTEDQQKPYKTMKTYIKNALVPVFIFLQFMISIVPLEASQGAANINSSDHFTINKIIVARPL